MRHIDSIETQIETKPEKFAIAEPTKLLTPIKGDPPMYVGRGRKANPVIAEIYKNLLINKDQWFHVNIPITSKKQLESLRTSLYVRGRKDSRYLSSSSLYNENTKMFDLWVRLN